MRNNPRQLIAILIVPTWLFVISGEAHAQTADPRFVSLGELAASARVWQPRLKLDALSLSIEGPADGARTQRRRSRDSLKNGTVVGAVVGAAALGTFAALVCKVQQEPGGPSCVPDTLRVAALGAAIGVGAGLAVDAALTRNGGVKFSVRITF